MSQWSAAEIHLPQTLNEEATADEFSDWEQVSSLALLCTSLTDSPLLPAPPAFLQPLGVVAAGGRVVVLRVGGCGYGEMDCSGRLYGAAGMGNVLVGG